MLAKPERKQWVYFIRCGSGPIKIGIATDMKTRLRMLQVGNHKPLSVYEAALYPEALARRIERLLHSRLIDHHISGEWFKPHPDVLAAARNPRGFVSDALEAQDRNALIFEDAA